MEYLVISSAQNLVKLQLIQKGEMWKLTQQLQEAGTVRVSSMNFERKFDVIAPVHTRSIQSAATPTFTWVRWRLHFSEAELHT